MELPSKDDKNSVVDKKAEAQKSAVIKANAEKQKNASEKTRSGFWSRLKHFTIEPRKTVVIENGVEKPIEKPAPIPQKAIVKEKPIEKPVSASQKAVVIEKPVEKPAPVLPVTPVVEAKVEKKPVTSTEKLKKGLEKTRGRFL